MSALDAIHFEWPPHLLLIGKKKLEWSVGKEFRIVRSFLVLDKVSMLYWLFYGLNIEKKGVFNWNRINLL